MVIYIKVSHDRQNILKSITISDLHYCAKVLNHSFLYILLGKWEIVRVSYWNVCKNGWKYSMLRQKQSLYNCSNFYSSTQPELSRVIFLLISLSCLQE